uniref:FYVE-type domain-containing protein n=1 Tax=Macrostomum lignano TaxID=282301 RepID=A0A1I8FJS2_9PLAT
MLQVLRPEVIPASPEVGAASCYRGITPQTKSWSGWPADQALDADKQQDRVSELIGELKECQQRVMKLMLELMNELIPDRRHPKDFRMKFPDEVVQEGLEGQLWYAVRVPGCWILHSVQGGWRLRASPAAGHSGDPRRREWTRRLLRDEASRSYFGAEPRANRRLLDQLALFDRILAAVRVELRGWPCCSPRLRPGPWLAGTSAAMTIDECEPTLMIVLPRLAVLHGLLVHPDGPLSTKDRPASKLCPLFRAFHSHLDRVRSFSRKAEAVDRTGLRRLCLTESGDATDAEADVDDDAAPRGCRVIAGVRGGPDSEQLRLELRYLLRCVYNLHCSEAVDEAAASAAAATATLAVEEGLDAFDWQVTDSVQSASTSMVTAAATGAEASAVEPPAWVPDSASDVCTNRRCGQAFTITRRRHHCRACGGLFCSACTRARRALPVLGFDSPVRLCDACCVSAAAVNENNGDRA